MKNQNAKSNVTLVECFDRGNFITIRYHAALPPEHIIHTMANPDYGYPNITDYTIRQGCLDPYTLLFLQTPGAYWIVENGNINFELSKEQEKWLAEKIKNNF